MFENKFYKKYLVCDSTGNTTLVDMAYPDHPNPQALFILNMMSEEWKSLEEWPPQKRNANLVLVAASKLSDYKNGFSVHRILNVNYFETDV